LVIPFRYRGLRISFRPLSYDPIVLNSILVRRVYGSVPRGCSVVDIGAHIGIFSIYSVLSGADRVLAFEPEQRNFQLLEKNLRTNNLWEKVQAFKSAVWSSDQERTLFVSKGTAFHGFFPDKLHVGGFESVSCIGINKLLHWVQQPVVLKIDAEGSEYEIVNAITDENMKRIERICVECHVGNPRLKSLLPVFLRQLWSQGFNVSSHSDNKIVIASREKV